jgi:peptidoglycan/LPS O-acetylase OafA/YrhL
MGGRAAPFRAHYWYDVPLLILSTTPWLFFTISGYVITRPFVDRLLTGRQLPATVPYALRRALRIFPLYVVALSAVIAINGTNGTKGWQLPFHYLLLQNLIPGQQQALFSVSWTLTIEVLFYASVPLLAAAVRGRGRTVAAERLAAVVLVSWLVSIGFTVIADLQGDGQIGLWLRGSAPAMWQTFCPGIMLAVVPHLRSPAWRRWLVDFPRRPAAIAVGVLAFAIGSTLFSYAPLRFGVVDYQVMFDANRPLFAVAYGLLIALAIRSRPWSGEGSWLFRLGLISYGVYLIHPVIEDLLLRKDLVPVPHGTFAALVVNSLCVAVPTVLLALASWRWFEQPAIELGRRLGDLWRGRFRAVIAPMAEPPL